MIVVADTSVILNLCRIQQEELLRRLFGRVIVPAQVRFEFHRLVSIERRFLGLALPSWLEVREDALAPPPAVVAANLDAGEAAAITLCVGLRADALLIDESLGRKVAAQLGLRTIGILGVLLEARRRGLAPKVSSLLDRLEREAGFWISRSLRDQVLQLAGE